MTKQPKQDYQDFLRWTHSRDGSAFTTEFQFAGFHWCCTTLETLWKVFFADTVQDPCTCITMKSEPKSPSKLLSDALSLIDHIEIGPDGRPSGRPSRGHSQSTSTTNKSLNPLARARHFFAGEPIKKINVEDDRAALATTVSDKITGSDANESENPTFGMWSDVRTAKRNADLLAKISAFETVGISITNNDGAIVFANDAWYNICGLLDGPTDTASWMRIFEPAEVLKIADLWKHIRVDQEPGHFQTPLKWRWESPAATDSGMTDFPVWISVRAYPGVSVDGETIGCCTVLTDISHQKWAERLIEQQLAEAVERAQVLEQLSNDLVLTENGF